MNHKNFQPFRLRAAAAAGQTAQLSDRPLIQALLQQIRVGNGNA